VDHERRGFRETDGHSRTDFEDVSTGNDDCFTDCHFVAPDTRGRSGVIGLCRGKKDRRAENHPRALSGMQRNSLFPALRFLDNHYATFEMFSGGD
jgi:hypothetical protein